MVTVTEEDERSAKAFVSLSVHEKEPPARTNRREEKWRLESVTTADTHVMRTTSRAEASCQFLKKALHHTTDYLLPVTRRHLKGYRDMA